MTATPGLMIQKDGSYALTMECPNGCVDPGLLEKVAQAAKEQNAIVHLTTAQKMMFLGLSEQKAKALMDALEDAGAVFRKARDLSHPRVCVGKPFCKLAFQDTFELGDILYKELAREPIPPKLKVAVSGCPACCSWANLMDLGFMGVRSGYKVLIGGKGGAAPKIGQEIGTITSPQEAVDILKKLAQLFSEEVKKKSRVDRVVSKIGIEEIKKRLGLG